MTARRATAADPLEHIAPVVERVLRRLCGCGCEREAAPEDTHAPECRRELDATYDREAVR